MALFTLADLHQVHQCQQPLLGLRTYESEFAFGPADPANFQLLMKQLFLGLPVQPLLNAHPLIARWVAEVQELVPELLVIVHGWIVKGGLVLVKEIFGG